MKNDPVTPDPESNDSAKAPANAPHPPISPEGMNSGCRECSQPVPSARGQKKQTRFCSDECRRKYWLKQKASGFRQAGSRTVAEIQKMLVAADLMKRGFKVYLALSPEFSDLAAQAGQRWLRVAVRTGYATGEGSAVPNHRPAQGTFELLAIVTSLGVYYQPPLESLKVHAEN